jgi:hypothetical protein
LEKPFKRTMKYVLWLEILTMIGYYGLMVFGFNQALMGHWGFVLISFFALAGVTLAGFAPIPGRWGEIPATLVLIRRTIWRAANLKFKEQYFASLVIYCMWGDYRRFMLSVTEKHKIDENVLLLALMDHYQGRMRLIHPHWLEIAGKTFITYGDVDRVQVSKVQHEFDKLSSDGMIAQFYQSLKEDNLDLIVENHLFYSFLHQDKK